MLCCFDLFELVPCFVRLLGNCSIREQAWHFLGLVCLQAGFQTARTTCRDNDNHNGIVRLNRLHFSPVTVRFCLAESDPYLPKQPRILPTPPVEYFDAVPAQDSSASLGVQRHHASIACRKVPPRLFEARGMTPKRETSKSFLRAAWL